MSTNVSKKDVSENLKKQRSSSAPGKTKFKVRIFMGDKEITHDELKNYVIKGNNTIDRIVNSVVDRAIVVNEGELVENSEEACFKK